jgi:hypothetical protein
LKFPDPVDPSSPAAYSILIAQRMLVDGSVDLAYALQGVSLLLQVGSLSL